MVDQQKIGIVGPVDRQGLRRALALLCQSPSRNRTSMATASGLPLERVEFRRIVGAEDPDLVGSLPSQGPEGVLGAHSNLPVNL